MSQKKELHVFVADVTQDWKTKEELAGNSFTGVTVYTDNIQDIIKAMELLGIKAFYIKTEGLGGQCLYVSPLVEKTEAKYKAERDVYNIAHQKLVETFNKEPIQLRAWQFGDFSVILERGEAKFDPSFSSHIQASLQLKLLRVNKVIRDWFNVLEYITDDGKIQKKKFLENFGYLISDRDLALTKAGEEIAQAMIEKLKEMDSVRREYQNKYDLR